MSETNTPTLLKRVPIFQDFTDSQIEKITNMTTSRALKQGEVLFLEGDPSTEMLIVLEGVLQIQSGTGSEIANVRSMGIVGEMGVLTDEPRSADVFCMEEAMGFQITKVDLINLFLSDGGICRKILLNLVKTLSQKLYDTNAEIQKLRDEQTREAPPKDDIFLY